MTCTVSPIETSDFQRWSRIFIEYCIANGCAKDQHKVVTVWSWLNDERHPLQGLIAYNAMGEILGLAHYHSMPDSLAGKETGHLADVYTTGAYQTLVETALYDAFQEQSLKYGWCVN